MDSAAAASMEAGRRGAAARVSPARLAACWSAKGYWRPVDLWTTFSACAAAQPHAPAMIEGERQLTFGALADTAARIGHGLRCRGVRAGDVVVVHSRNSIEAVQALLACTWLGAVMAPVPPLFSAAQLEGVCRSAAARAMIVLGEARDGARAIEAARGAQVPLIVASDPAPHDTVERWADLQAEGAPAARGPVDPDALALLVYSSGTTGAPKGVMHSSNTVRYAIEQRARLHGVGPGDVGLVVAQFGFVGSVVFGLLMGPLTGAGFVLLPAWSGDEAVRLIERHRISYGLMMPTHVHDVLASSALAQADVSSFTRCAMGGLTRARRLEVMRRLCPKPLPAYGMSECLGYTSCALDALDERALSTEGHPYPGTETRVVGPDGALLEAGVVGAIEVRGPSRFLGYYGAPALTAEAIDADGWFRTGDVGRLDERRYLTFVAREKDIIRRGGLTIVPGDLEAVLMAHPRIEHVAVVGLPDDRLGERACCCVVTKDGEPMALGEVTTFLEDHGVARYTWPERVEAFDSFPRSASLKVQKRALIEALNTRYV